MGSDLTLEQAEQMVRVEGTLDSLLVYAQLLEESGNYLGELINLEHSLETGTIDADQRAEGEYRLRDLYSRRIGYHFRSASQVKQRFSALISGVFAGEFWRYGFPRKILPALDAEGNLMPVENADLVGLAKSEYSSLLHALCLSGLEEISDISPLAEIKQLRVLNLDHTSVVDLKPLMDLRHLQDVSLYHTSVEDISPLASLSELRRLDLSCSLVTDLSPLKGILHLKVLELDRGAQGGLDTGMLRREGLKIDYY